MTEDNMRVAIDRALHTLDGQLARGYSAPMLRYLRTMRHVRWDYSEANKRLIFAQRPDATRVAGYHAWKQVGRYVRRGEAGIRIYVPTGYTPDLFGGMLPQYRLEYVFDIRQTGGRPLPEPPTVTGNPGNAPKELEAFITEELGVRVEYASALRGAFSRVRRGHIEVLHGLPPARRLSVLAHVAAHHILHIGPDGDMRLPHSLMETQAGAVAHVVCAVVGLRDNNAAADYITLHGGTRAQLRASHAEIHHAAGILLAGLKATPRPRVGSWTRAVIALIRANRSR